MKTLEYKAPLGLGVVFAAKTFVHETEKNIYLISPGPLDAPTIDYLKNSNKGLHFISPNGFHYIYLKKCYRDFPDANFYGGRRVKLKTGLDLLSVKNLDGDEIKVFEILGNPILEEYALITAETKELILTDLVFNLGKDVTFMSMIAFRLFGVYNKLGTSLLLKLTTKDKEQFRQSIRELLELDFDKVLLNHGKSISKSQLVNYLNDTFLK